MRGMVNERPWLRACKLVQDSNLLRPIHFLKDKFPAKVWLHDTLASPKF